jgi:hypothetical protein
VYLSLKISLALLPSDGAGYFGEPTEKGGNFCWASIDIEVHLEDHT